MNTKQNNNDNHLFTPSKVKGLFLFKAEIMKKDLIHGLKDTKKTKGQLTLLYVPK